MPNVNTYTYYTYTIHIADLHFLFGQCIQEDINTWQDAHNYHPVRTEQNMTPLQLWYQKVC